MQEQVRCRNCGRGFWSNTAKITIVLKITKTKDGKDAREVFFMNTKVGKPVHYPVINFLPKEAKIILQESIETLILENMDEGTVEIPVEMLCQACSNWVRHRMQIDKQTGSLPKSMHIH